MANNRRPSSNYADAIDGEVYKIYTEVANAGKTIEGSKKRIKWLFGYTGSDQDHEVVLIHSLVSGKKTILENGSEIVSVSSVLAQDFSHGWQSNAGRRIYRVEANIGVASEHFYTFSVDGVRFVEMPTKAATNNNTNRRPSSNRNSITVNNGRNEAKTFSASPPQRRASTGTILTSGDRNSFAQSDFMDNKTNSFDPFDSTDGVDPFASSSPTNNISRNITRTKSSSPPVAVAVPVKTTTASLFDNFDDEEESVVVQPSRSVNFDPFGASPSSDPFEQTASPSTDPFGTSSSASYQTSFNSNAPKLAAPVEKQSTVMRRASLSQQTTTDFLSTSNDDLFSAPSEEKSYNKKSADEISRDFAGLRFDVPAPVVPSFSLPTNKEEELPKEEEPVQEEVIPTDPWDVKNLVDLDLTGKNKQVARKQSSVAGPSLDSLMGGHHNNNSVRQQPSFSSNSSVTTSDPIFALINKGTDPFGNSTLTPSSLSSTPPPAQRPVMLSHADTISSFGQPPPYMMQPPPRPVYGLGLGVQQQSPPFGGPTGMMPPPPGPGMGGMRGPPPPYNPMGQPGPNMMMANKPVYGSGMMANKPAVVGLSNFGTTNTGSYGNSNNNNPPKNSLDSLNWKG